MFAIRLLPETQRGSDGERLGEIVVDDFRETFSCHLENYAELEYEWGKRLRALLEGEPAIALRHDPRFAWIVFREGSDCFVQQRLSIGGDFAPLLPRVTVYEENDAVSEWKTSIHAIRGFLDKESNRNAGPTSTRV
ncbi:MAG: hypothetical protein KF873_04475 [Gemmataceae bacterium]|nr:hypothetical protein [Gemmataceae bacterium]